MAKSLSMQKAKAILPKLSGFLSILGSGFIIYDILKSHFEVSPLGSWRKGNGGMPAPSKFSSSFGSNRSHELTSRRIIRKNLNNSAYYRLMLCMSISDLMTSVAWFCSTWPIPADAPPGIYGNIGNRKTCTAQGFFIQLGIITPFYNAILALYYFLTIRHEWKEPAFKVKVEYIGHFVSIGWGFGTAIAGLALQLYNNSGVWCYVSAHPSGCDKPESTIDCERGESAKVMRIVLYYAPLWLAIFLVCYFMFMVFLYVRALEKKMDSYTRRYQDAANARMKAAGDKAGMENKGKRGIFFAKMSAASGVDINEQRQRKRFERSRAVAGQGLLYAATFITTWLFGTVVRVSQLASRPYANWTLLLFAFLTPSQGFFNFVVYVRPRIIQYMKERKKKERENKNHDSVGSEILRVSGISSTNDVGDASNKPVPTYMQQTEPNSTQQTDMETSDQSLREGKMKQRSHSKVRFVGFAMQDDAPAQSDDEGSASINDFNVDEAEGEELGDVLEEAHSESNGFMHDEKEEVSETKLDENNEEKGKEDASEPVQDMDIKAKEDVSEPVQNMDRTPPVDNNESVDIGIGDTEKVEESNQPVEETQA